MDWTSVVSMRGMHAPMLLTVCNTLNCGCNEGWRKKRKIGGRGREGQRKGKKEREGKENRGEGKKNKKIPYPSQISQDTYFRVSCCYANMLLCPPV